MKEKSNKNTIEKLNDSKQEIENPFKVDIEFDSQLRGYNMEQVDKYICELTNEYNKMYMQYQQIFEENQELKKDNSYYRQRTDKIARLLIDEVEISLSNLSKINSDSQVKEQYHQTANAVEEVPTIENEILYLNEENTLSSIDITDTVMETSSNIQEEIIQDDETSESVITLIGLNKTVDYLLNDISGKLDLDTILKGGVI